MTQHDSHSSEQKTTGSFRAGMASIVGRPNVGKSTLLNAVLGQKVAIVSSVPQTTRMPVRGIYTDDERQIVFIDTPGLHPSKDRLGEWMNTAAFAHVQGVDAVVHLVDVSEPIGEEEQRLIERLNKLPCPVVLGLNKVDVTDRFIPDYIEAWRTAAPQRFGDDKSFVLLPLSGLKRTNVDKLIGILSDFMPVSPPLYPPDMISDVPIRQAVADIIREKCLAVLREEVPHSLGVIIESMRPGKNHVIYIRACLIVERESQKAIVIGKGGRLLKHIGTLAREELEFLLKSRVYLELFVKSQKDWRHDMRTLMEMGFQPLHEGDNPT